MRIPQSFFKAIDATFYDKEIERLTTVTITGQLGGKTIAPGEPVSVHACNVQTVRDKMLAEQYGLVMGRDIIITAQTLPIAKGDFVRYDGRAYRVIEAPQHDSHIKLLAKAVV